MKTITAVIRCVPGGEETMKAALLEVGANVRAAEPETISFHVSQSDADPCVFTTHERFADQAAMDRHNNSATVAAFFEVAKPLLDGEVVLVTGDEIFTR